MVSPFPDRRRVRSKAAAVMMLVILMAASCSDSASEVGMPPLEAASHACTIGDRDVLTRAITEADDAADGFDSDISFLLRDLGADGPDFDQECEYFRDAVDLAFVTPEPVSTPAPAATPSPDPLPSATAVAAPSPSATAVAAPSPAVPAGEDLSAMIFAAFEQSDDPLAQVSAVVPFPVLNLEIQDAELRAFSAGGSLTGEVGARVVFRTSMSFVDARDELQLGLSQVPGPVAVDDSTPKDGVQRNQFRIEPAVIGDDPNGVIGFVLDARDDGAEVSIFMQTTDAETAARIVSWPGGDAPFPSFNSVASASFLSQKVSSMLTVEYVLSVKGSDVAEPDLSEVLAAEFEGSLFELTELGEGDIFDFTFSGPYNGWVNTRFSVDDLEVRYVANISTRAS